VITAGDTIKAAGLIGDHAREYIEPTGRTFWIGCRRDVRRQHEAFNQRHDIDAAGFENRAGGKRKFVEL
jgi:hypothetical protein